MKLKKKVVSLTSISVLSYTHINLQVFPQKLLLQFLLRHVCLKTASSILYAINSIQYPYCLDVTACHRLYSYRHFGIK